MVFNALAATLIKGWPSRLWHGTSGAGDLPRRARRLFLLKLHKLRMPCHDKRRAARPQIACIPGSPLRVVRDSGILLKNIKLQLLTTATAPEEPFQLTSVFLLNAYWDLQRFARLHPFDKTVPAPCYPLSSGHSPVAPLSAPI